jgi:hypothetical protein
MPFYGMKRNKKMRQGNGAEILGTNDPRSVTIGMIYVAPNDDRESVLAAILTQAKLGRKYIAVVLPAQNKSFQRSLDFESLKNMRRKLQAQLIIIAPTGSRPAELARQRSFKVYPSVEIYTQSLQEDYLAAQTPKRGGLSGRKVKQQINAQNGNTEPAESYPIMPVPLNNINHEDITQPALAQPVEDQDTLLSPHGMSSSPDQPIESMPTQEIQNQPAVDADVTQSFSAPTQSNAEPGIIALATSRKKKAGSSPIPVVLPGNAVEPVVPIDTGTQHQENIAVPVAAATAAAVAGAGGSKVSRASSGGSRPPARAARANAGRTPPPPGSYVQQRPRFWIVSLIVLLVLSVLFCGGLAIAAPSTFSGIGGIFSHSNLSHVLTGTPTATVTLVPKSTQLANTYEISAVTGTPVSSQREVQARQLTYTTATQSKTVNATGVKQTPATQATGSLTFYNALGTSQTVSSGTVFNVGNGIQIENTSQANIPAAHPPTEGSVTVNAQAVTSGSRGNIAANTLYLSPCCASGITVSNTSAFSGGQDPQNYTVVAQSDVNNAATPLGNQLLQTAQTSLKSQVHSGEVFSGQPQCSTNVTSNPAVGTASKTVTVNVSATCSGEVYDQSGAESLTTTLLQDQGNKQAGYILTGIITTSQPQVISVNAKTGTILLLVKAQGTWVYQFNDTQKKDMAKAIAGKTKAQAQSILLKQTGVSAVSSIDISGGNGKTLPTDYTQITITTSSVSTTPTPGSGSPTGSPIPVTPGTGTPTGPGLTPTSGRE